MASSSFKKLPNGRYRARYRDAEGREHSRNFTLQKDAKAWLDQVTAAVVTGRYVDPRDAATTLRVYACEWERTRVSGESQASITDNALRLHILPILGHRPLAALRRSEVQALVKALAQDLAPNTVRSIYEVLRRCLEDAVTDRMIPASPCVRIDLPAAPDLEVNPPSIAQIAALSAALPARYAVLPRLLAGSGLRIGEALGVQVPADVDFLRRTLRVERQRLQNGRLAPPKTAKSKRTIPLAQWVLDDLAEHLAAYPAVEGWPFTNTRGRPLTYPTWKLAWTAATAATKLAVEAHDLRHAYASALIAGGASVKAVQAALGHSSPVVTLRVYTHLWPGDEDRTRSIIETAFSGLRPICGRSGGGAGEPAGQRPTIADLLT